MMVEKDLKVSGLSHIAHEYLNEEYPHMAVEPKVRDIPAPFHEALVRDAHAIFPITRDPTFPSGPRPVQLTSFWNSHSCTFWIACVGQVLVLTAAEPNWSFKVTWPQQIEVGLIKTAMLRLDRIFRRRNMEAHIVSVIHDALWVECPEEEAEQLGHLARKMMTTAGKLKVPLGVDIR